MTVPKFIGAFVVALPLALVSIPFIVLALGADMCGDDESADRWMARAPLEWWLNWLESL